MGTEQNIQKGWGCQQRLRSRWVGGPELRPAPGPNTRSGPVLARVFHGMISRAGRRAVARHAIEVNSEQWSLIFFGRAQFLYRIKVQESGEI